MTGSSTEGIKTVLHPVSDLATAKPVYTALLGIPPQARRAYYVGYDVAGQHIGLVPGGGPQGMTSPVAYWHVPDIEAKLAEVTAAGATVKEPVRDVGGGRLVATVTDPDGNVLGLLQDQSTDPADDRRPGRDRAGGCRTEGDTMSMATRTDTQPPALHAADSHDLIRVHGARVNNLKDVSVEIPKRRLTVFTGVSGSGKSSLVFDTIAAESQRLINETYSTFVQGFMPTLARPEVDVLEGLTTAIIVDQQRMGADPRSTVGTATDANAMLRILFSRLGQPHIGSPQAFSFNVASISGAGAVTFERGGKTVKERRSFSITGGMCPRCEGLGTVSDIDLAQLFDDSKSLNEGAITVPGYTGGGWNSRLYSESGFYDPDKPIRKFTKKELHDFLHHEPVRMKIAGINMTYEGLIPRIQRSMLSKDKEAMQPHIRAFVDRAVTFTACPECGGTRLTEAARSSKIKGISIADACAMQISDLAGWVRRPRRAVGGAAARRRSADPRLVRGDRPGLPQPRPPVGHAVRRRGAAHQDDPPARVRRSPTSPTSSTSRPSGMHPHDVQRMNDLLLRLRDKGNTVLVVEHKPETIAIADHVVDLGPGAGTAGGEVVLRGHRRGAAGQRHPHRPPPRRPGRAQAEGADARRARWRSAAPAPTTCRTSTSTSRSACWSSSPASPGSGKSSLMHGSIAGRDGRGVGRPGRDPRLAAKQPGDLHRAARPDPRPRSRRPTASRRRCSAPTPRAPAPTATASASSTPTWR